MKILSAQFVKSSPDLKSCPPANKPEYAFIGRSNVGKSSLINMLCGKTNLAKISATPGKTQLINHFSINDQWFLVDLPGYGFAHVSQSKRSVFSKFTKKYLLERTNLMCVMLLIDSRIPMQEIDKSFMDWMAESDIPFIILFTKTDKLTKKELAQNLKTYRAKMMENWVEMPEHYLTSAEKNLGKDEILQYIHQNNLLFKL